MRVDALAQAMGAVLQGSEAAAVEIDAVAGAAQATSRSLVFAESEAALAAACNSGAGAVVTTAELASKSSCGKPVLIAPHPRLAFAKAARALRLQAAAVGVHPTAQIADGVSLGAEVSVGAYAVVAEGARVGDRSSIGAGCVVGARAVLGPECRLYPRVVLYPGVTLGARVVVHAGAVLGADGFGYVRDAQTGEYLQFPQQGTLVIEDDVEIGANATVDRGALEETRIARGTKIDNLVHVGHNVRVGQNVVIAAQTGVSGSSVIGDGAVVGGQVGIADHVVIGEQVILGAQAGIPSRKRLRGPGVVFWGTPARPIKDYLKELAALARLVRSSKQAGPKEDMHED